MKAFPLVLPLALASSSSLLLLLLPPHLAHAAKERLVLEELAGDQTVIIVSGKDLQPHAAQVGEQLQFWDVVQTSKRAAAKIRYPDGSLLIVGRDTKFTIQPRMEGTQFNQLDWGQVRAQVTKDEKDEKALQDAKTEKEKEEIRKKPPRFVIRTKTAVMGVRGTDFVAGFDAGSSQASLHTIDGAVQIGGSESAVMSWQGTPVSTGQTASLDTSGSVNVASFQPEEYKAEIKAKQPELSAQPDHRVDPSRPETAIPAAASMANVPVRPDDAAAGDELPALSLLGFRAGAVTIVQNSKIQFTTVGIGWTPSYRIIGPLSVRGFAGGFVAKNAGTGSMFPVLKGAVLADLDVFMNLHLEAGAGYEQWRTDEAHNATVNSPILTANVAWHFAPRKWINLLYAGVAKMTIEDQSGDPNGGAYIPLQGFAGVGMRF